MKRGGGDIHTKSRVVFTFEDPRSRLRDRMSDSERILNAKKYENLQMRELFIQGRFLSPDFFSSQETIGTQTSAGALAKKNYCFTFNRFNQSPHSYFALVFIPLFRFTRIGDAVSNWAQNRWFLDQRPIG